MSTKQNNNILIIGGPDAGKTHFGGQLYGRLAAKESHYRITSPPENIAFFKEVLDRLNDGKSAGHTNVNAHDNLELQVESEGGLRFTFSYPDYGGEQIMDIVKTRRINEVWKAQIDESNAWMLFIRLDKVKPVEDIVNRGIPEQGVLKRRGDGDTEYTISDAAFYIELLQILLYASGTRTKSIIGAPMLTIVLSCYDLIPEAEKTKLPKDILNDKIPALYSFVTSTWSERSFKVVGLSSLGRSLSADVADKEFSKKGPENFGYIIDESGKENEDLTLSIRTFIEN
jgi:hypothetical protein